MATEKDKQLAAAALEKTRAGKRPSKAESRALDRVRKEAEEQRRNQAIREVPKKDFAAMLGRQQKTINEWVGRYGMPAMGITIDLAAVLAWLGNFLVDNSQRLNAADETGVDSPALEQQREEQAKILRIKRKTLELSLVPRGDIHAALTNIAAIIRSAGEQLEKHHGPDARAILDEALDDADREIDSLAADGIDHQ